MRQNKFLTLLVALILLFSLLDAFFHFSPIKDLFEKRLPTQKPQFPKNYSELLQYPKNFEKFFDDNYGFRKTLITMNSRLMDKVFDESPDARAVVGNEGWFYFDNYNSLLDAAGRAQISDELIERGVNSFYQNWQKMRAQKIDYLLVIAPDKSTIYPEFLPSYIEPKNPHRIDKFLAALKKKYPDFPVLDLREIVLKAKEKEILYQKTDTHWNSRGAHFAYVEIMKLLKIKPNLRSEFDDKSDEMIRGDISDIMGVETTNLNYDLIPKFKQKANLVLVSEEEQKQFHKPIFSVNENKNLPVLFVYKDSFFGELVRFVSEHFSQAFYVNEFPCDLNYEIIKNYHPNIVIQQFWEGRLETVLKQCKDI
jgi:alginate O-acetyltransferase complex protein AlgJ